jgi:hypothetical protein
MGLWQRLVGKVTTHCIEGVGSLLGKRVVRELETRVTQRGAA